MPDINVPYLRNDEIARQSKLFLKQYEIDDAIPVPIEETIEYKLSYDIIPTPRLHDQYEVDGLTAFRAKSIYVDSFIYDRRETRYRFTLAHEAGHIFMHSDIFSSIPIESLDEWKQFVSSIEKGDYDKLEYQGYAFAGLVLVPQNHLESLFNEHLTKVMPLIQQAKNAGLQKKDYLEYAVEHMASLLAPYFNVSTGVVIRRLNIESYGQLFL